MKRAFATVLSAMVLCVSLQSGALGQERREAAKARQILPHNFTEEELRIPRSHKTAADLLRSDTPAGNVRYTAEYQPSAGVLIQWSGFLPLFTEVIVELAQPGSDTIVYLVVPNASTQASATSTLASAGADMDYVEFITYQTNSNWIRDYGPLFVFEDDVRVIVDAQYGASRPLDDGFPSALGNLWYEQDYALPLYHYGGNHLSDSGEHIFVSSIVLDDNPGFSEAEIVDLFEDYFGAEVLIYPALPSTIDGTGHIDMWLALVSDTVAIVSEFTHVDPSYPGITVTEAGAADLVSRGYTVYRVPAYNAGSGGYNGTHYTYTNSLILNDKVFIPEYGGSHAANDDTALSAYQAAMPGHTIIPVDCSDAILYYGAIHCLSMHVPAYLSENPVVNVVSPGACDLWSAGEDHEIKWTAGDDEGITGVDLYYSIDGGATYPYIIATGEPNDGTLLWTVPSTVSARCRLKIVGHDADLNTGEDISEGYFSIVDQHAETLYSFDLDTNPAWTTTGLWAWGVPSGDGGSHGGPDPESGHTGSHVYGYNLSGDYTASMPEQHLTSTALDCSDAAGCTLRFWRWLGVETSDYDHAYVRVSNDGANWTTVWQNGPADLYDGGWVEQVYDISLVADHQPTVYLRWTMGTSDTWWQWCGWNIDDILIRGLTLPAVVGDMDDDCDVDLADYRLFEVCLIGPGGGVLANCGLADLDDDGDVDLADFAEFQGVFSGVE